MTGMTWLMVVVVLAWSGVFIYLTINDLRCENHKSAILAEGKEVDPFEFSGERARAEAREAYLNNDPVLKKYFEEEDIVKFLGIDK